MKLPFTSFTLAFIPSLKLKVFLQMWYWTITFSPFFTSCFNRPPPPGTWEPSVGSSRWLVSPQWKARNHFSWKMWNITGSCSFCACCSRAVNFPLYRFYKVKLRAREMKWRVVLDTEKIYEVRLRFILIWFNEVRKESLPRALTVVTEKLCHRHRIKRNCERSRRWKKKQWRKWNYAERFRENALVVAVSHANAVFSIIFLSCSP